MHSVLVHDCGSRPDSVQTIRETYWTEQQRPASEAYEISDLESKIIIINRIRERPANELPDEMKSEVARDVNEQRSCKDYWVLVKYIDRFVLGEVEREHY